MFYTQLSSIMEKQEMTITDLSTTLSLDKEYVIDKIVNNQEMTFETIKKIAAYFPEEKQLIMEDYINQAKDPNNLLKCLEYASIHVMKDTSIRLIERLSAGIHSLPKYFSEWIQWYRFSYQYQIAPVSPPELVRGVKSTFSSSKELIVFKKIIEIYLLNEQKKYDLVLHLCEELEQLLFVIEPGYIRSSYLIRFCEIYAIALLKRPRTIEKARLYALKIVEESTSLVFKGHAMINIGFTYMFDDYEESLAWFQRAKDLFQKLQLVTSFERAEKNIEFLKNVWNRHEDPDSIYDLSELAHYLIKNGRAEEGLEILDEMEKTPFRLFYRWLATKEEKVLYEAVSKFRARGQYFYLHYLVKPELLKSGVNAKLATILCS